MHLTTVSILLYSPIQRFSDTGDLGFVALSNIELLIRVLKEQVVDSELIYTAEASTKTIKIFLCNFRSLLLNEDFYNENVKLSLISLIQYCNLQFQTKAKMIKHILLQNSYNGSPQITAAELGFLFVILKNLG